MSIYEAYRYWIMGCATFSFTLRDERFEHQSRCACRQLIAGLAGTRSDSAAVDDVPTDKWRNNPKGTFAVYSIDVIGEV